MTLGWLLKGIHVMQYHLLSSLMCTMHSKTCHNLSKVQMGEQNCLQCRFNPRHQMLVAVNLVIIRKYPQPTKATNNNRREGADRWSLCDIRVHWIPLNLYLVRKEVRIAVNVLLEGSCTDKCDQGIFLQERKIHRFQVHPKAMFSSDEEFA